MNGYVDEKQVVGVLKTRDTEVTGDGDKREREKGNVRGWRPLTVSRPIDQL